MSFLAKSSTFQEKVTFNPGTDFSKFWVSEAQDSIHVQMMDL